MKFRMCSQSYLELISWMNQNSGVDIHIRIRIRDILVNAKCEVHLRCVCFRQANVAQQKSLYKMQRLNKALWFDNTLT